MNKTTLYIRGNHLRKTKELNNKFESIFGGRKIAKIYDRNIIEQLLKLYNK